MSLKVAVTRSVKEWRQAAGSGNQAYADQIAGASGQLGLKPRYVENISGGGMEAGVDKMIGRAMGPEANQSGYVAQKLYKPDSPIATGKGMSELLATKKHMTDSAQALSPAAKNMVPSMYGHREISGPSGELRHVSQHEYVPGAQSLRRDPNIVSHVENIQNTLSSPMAAKGMPMKDIPRLMQSPGGPVGVGGNISNAVVTPHGPKVIDFLPAGMSGSSSTSSMMGVLQRGKDDVAYSNLGSGKADTAYGKSNMTDLRREVFRPGSSPVPRAPAALSAATAVASPAAKKLAPMAGGATKVTAVARPTVQNGVRNAATKVTKFLGKVAHMIDFSSFCEELSDYKHALPMDKWAEDQKSDLYHEVVKKMPHLAQKPAVPKKLEEKNAAPIFEGKGFDQLIGGVATGTLLGTAIVPIAHLLTGKPQSVKSVLTSAGAGMGAGAWAGLGMGMAMALTGKNKKASAAGTLGKALSGKGGKLKRVGEHLIEHGNDYDLAGLGVLAAPSAVSVAKQVRSGKPIDKHQMAHDAAEIGGLGLIAAPVAAARLMGRGH